MFEAYHVAVRVSLINGVTNGLMNISRSFAKAHGDAAKLQRQLDQIKFKLIGGAALAGTGMFGLSLLGKTLPYAKEYTRQLALMNTLGMKQADIARVVSQAWKTTNLVPTSTAARNLESFRELRSAFGSDSAGQAHAAMMLPVVARLSAVMQSLTGKEQSHVGFDMVKAIELRTGVMTEAALQRNSELMSKAIIGMGGTVTAADFHGALKMGKIASNKWSDDFAYSYLPTLMQELKTAHGGGAQSAGTILMSLYQQMHGKMTKAAMPLWVQSGLVKQSDVVKTSTGQYQVKPGAVAGTDVFEQNPYQWVQSYLRPAVDRLVAQKHISAETAINAMFSNRNAAFGAYNMYFKAAQYDRDKATINKADGGYGAFQKLLKTDPTLAAAALHSQWQNLLAIIGYQIMPSLISGTLALVKGLRALTDAMRAHPTLTRALVIGFAALSGALLFGGTVLLLSAAFDGLGLALKVLQVAKLWDFASAITGIGNAARAAGFAPGGVATAGAAAGSGAAATAVGVAGIAAVGLAGAYMSIRDIKREAAYKRAKQDLAHASTADLVTALDVAKFYERSNAQRAGGRHPSPFFGRLAAQAREQEAQFQGELNRRGSRYVAPGAAAGGGTVVVPVHLDGRQIARVVAKHQAKELGHTAISSGRPDPNAALPPAAAGYR